jgi:hypothetical protein
MTSYCHMLFSRHTAPMRGEMWTKNSSGLKSNVPFVTERFRTKLLFFWEISCECHACYLNATLLIEVHVTDQNSSGISRGKSTSLHTDISLTSTGVGAWDGSVTCDVSVNPLECEAKEERKTVSTFEYTALMYRYISKTLALATAHWHGMA